MSEDRALALAETMSLGDVMVKSGFFQDAKDKSQAVVKILAGQELGIAPIASMRGIYISQRGQVSLSAALIAAQIKGSKKYDYRVIKLDDKEAVVKFYQADKSGAYAEIGESSFTIEDAQRAGLTGKDTWKNYPRNLLFARAISNGARWYTPDVFSGAIYTPEELGNGIPATDAPEVIEWQVREIKPTPTTLTSTPEGDKPDPFFTDPMLAAVYLEDGNNRKAFWKWAKEGLGLSEDDAHEKADCASFKDFKGTIGELRALLAK